MMIELNHRMMDFIRNPNNKIITICLLVVLFCFCHGPIRSSAQAPTNKYTFYNHSGCLYANMESSGIYTIQIPGTDTQNGTLSNIVYEDSLSICYDNKADKNGKLVISSQINDNYMNSMKIEFEIKPPSAYGYWEFQRAFLTINPVNSKLFSNDVIELKTVDMYAGQYFSFSCSSLVLKNAYPNKEGQTFKITLKHFQVQPFHELERHVFAPSFDCAVWLTLPQISGLILVLFVTFTVMIGVYLIAEQGNQNGDLKFSKQGGMLLNQAQLDATKG